MGVTSDWLGRRKAISFGCIWGVIGAALMAGAAHVGMREFSHLWGFIQAANKSPKSLLVGS